MVDAPGVEYIPQFEKPSHIAKKQCRQNNKTSLYY